MSILNVPLIKDNFFENELKRLILHNIDSMYMEYDKFPDTLILTGRLGKILFEMISTNKWNFGPVKVKLEKSISNRMIICYEKPITVKDKTSLNIPKETLDNKIIEGWSGNEIVNKAMSFSNSFNLEKLENPKITIKLRAISKDPI